MQERGRLKDGEKRPPLWRRTIAWIENRRRLSWWLSALVLALAVADGWSARHHVNPDGISYLDVGNTVFAHGIKAGANVTWSPVYTWILGGALELLQPSRSHELLLVMGVNVVITAVVLAVFAWWLSELFSLMRARGTRLLISEPILVLLAYGVVAWAVLRTITVTVVSPDMLLAATAFAGTAILMRIARVGGSPLTWIALGVVIGLGYLTKSGFVGPAVAACAAVPVLTSGGIPRRTIGLSLSVLALLCVSVPFIAVLSSREGQLEIGSNGTLNYAWNVDRVTLYLNWTGGNGEFGRPLHPTLIATAPNTFAYASPIAGSIPIWYDPSYWYQGVHAKFIVDGQIHALGSSVYHTLRISLDSPLILLFVPVAMLWRVRDREHRTPSRPSQLENRRSWSGSVVGGLVRHSYLALSLVGIAAYLPLHTEARFIGGYVAILAITGFLLACGWPQRERLSTARVAQVSGLTAVVAAIILAYAALGPVDHVVAQLAGGDAPGTTDLRVARALKRAGVRAGDGIVFVGEPAGVPDAYWARLDRARVVGNISNANGDFWRMPPAVQEDRLTLLRKRSGASFAISDQPAARSATGWIRIAGTGDFYRSLSSD